MVVKKKEAVKPVIKKKRPVGKLSKAAEAEVKTDAEILQLLKNEIVKQINGGTINMKVGDFLKIIEIQRKLSSDNGAADKFWEFIEKIRQQALSDD